MDEFYFIQNYKDLLTQIEIHENIIENAEKNKEYYIKQLHEPKDIKAICYDGMPHGNYSEISLDRIVEYINKYDSMVEIETNILQQLEKAKDEIDKKINSLTGLYFKVAYMKEIEGKTLQEIADKLGYSIDRIKQVSAELGKNK